MVITSGRGRTSSLERASQTVEPEAEGREEGQARDRQRYSHVLAIHLQEKVAPNPASLFYRQQQPLVPSCSTGTKGAAAGE
jgi:hypothetical protein